MGDLLKFPSGEKMAKKAADDRLSPEEWEKLAQWIQIPVEILTQLNGAEIMQATQRAILRGQRLAGERVPSKVKLPTLRKG